MRAGSLLCIAIAIPVCALLAAPLGADQTAPAPPAQSSSTSTTPAKPGANGTVVHFGDSFVDAGLQQALRPKFAASATRYFSFGKTSAWLSTWAFGTELDQLYSSYHPTLVLITLGANDLENIVPDSRAPLVHRIVGKLHGTPCVWISTPLWKGAPAAFNDMIRRNCAPCRHFDTAAINPSITKQRDGKHPDRPGGAVWAEALWTWLQNERDPSQGYWALKPASQDEHAPLAASPAPTTQAASPAQSR